MSLDSREGPVANIREFAELHGWTPPTHYEVCPTCQGRGRHVNPSIDAHGITAEEWAYEWTLEDREDYRNGAYDVICNECGGDRVVEESDVDSLTDDQLNEWLGYLQDVRDHRHEIAMGY